MPSLPEMLFGDNVLRIQHTDGFGIEFNAIDALKRVNNLQHSVQVACAQEWQESRWDLLSNTRNTNKAFKYIYYATLGLDFVLALCFAAEPILSTRT